MCGLLETGQSLGMFQIDPETGEATLTINPLFMYSVHWTAFRAPQAFLTGSVEAKLLSIDKAVVAKVGLGNQAAETACAA